jgi:hypothetical protein
MALFLQKHPENMANNSLHSVLYGRQGGCCSLVTLGTSTTFWNVATLAALAPFGPAIALAGAALSPLVTMSLAGISSLGSDANGVLEERSVFHLPLNLWTLPSCIFTAFPNPVISTTVVIGLTHYAIVGRILQVFGCK